MHHAIRARFAAPSVVFLTCYASATGLAGDISFTDASADLLPMAALNGRSMDAEFADLDGDGVPELIVASEVGANVVCGYRDGRWVYREDVIPQGRVSDSEDIAVADFDGDGKPDICFATEDDRDDELYLSSVAEEGMLLGHAHDRVGFGAISNCVLAFDIDSDGDVDLVFGNAGAESVLLNDGSGRFEALAGVFSADFTTTQDMELADIDGDGDMDIGVANEDPNALYVNESEDGRVRYRISPAQLPDAGTGEETREVDFGDVDGDGDVDMILANVPWKFQKKPANRLLLNDGSGYFSDETADRLPDDPPMTTLDADFADLDGDGDLDLITANTQTNRPVRVYLNDGAGRFTDVTESALSAMQFVHAIDVEVVDLNGDGKMDIYVANHIGPDRALIQD